MKRRNIALLGSTGSIGRQTLEVAATHPERLRIVALAAGKKNLPLLAEQMIRFRPKFVAVPDAEAAGTVRGLVPKFRGEIGVGEEGLVRAAAHPAANTVVGGLVGFKGLLPTMAAIRAGKRICLANKETLVVAGALVTALAREHKVPLIPIDSEHSALLQSLQGSPEALEKIILTASGGPFRERSREEMAHATPAMALKHPNWSMGAKITIDSATLMNKGLEIIEARWLFNVGYDRIEVVIHPQSIVHSLVQFHDGSVVAQLGLPDMKLPILYALTYPERLPTFWPRLSLAEVRALTFHEPDPARFPCLRLAREAGMAGGTAPAVLNAANEVAVELFLEERIGFLGIPALIESVLEARPPLDGSSLSVEAVLEADAWTRRATRDLAAREAFRLISVAS